jgi:hypothetical protein
MLETVKIGRDDKVSRQKETENQVHEIVKNIW